MVTRGMAAATAMVLGMAAATPHARAGEVIGGLYVHDVTFVGNLVGLGAAGREDGVDVLLGYRTGALPGLSLIKSPQVHAFISINSENTSNFAAVGLSWRFRLADRLYFRPGIGLAYTDGKTGHPPANVPGLSQEEVARRTELYYTRIDFGSRLLFEPELALGYDIGQRFAVEASYVHLSHGQIFHSGKNQGLDEAGLRLIWKLAP